MEKAQPQRERGHITITDMEKAAQIHTELEALLEEKDFFGLRRGLHAAGNDVSAADRLFFGAVVESAFNNTALSERYIDEFMRDHAAGAEEDYLIELLKVHADNLLREFRYGEAAEAYGLILDRHGDACDDQLKEEIANSRALWSAVSGVAPQQMHIGADTVIPYHRNGFGHVMVEAATQSAQGMFMFDTGANISSVTESWAEKMGMQIIEAGIKVVTSTGMTVRTRLAVADSLHVGGLLFRNVIFLVMRDEQLHFEEFDFKIDGIVGIPVIRQMREVRISADNITVPMTPEYRQGGNLCFESLMPLVQGESRGEKLIFTFDTGASHSELSHRYWQRHREAIEAEGHRVTKKRAGGGGVIEAESYELGGFPLTIGGREIVMPRIDVSLNEYVFNEDKDGNLGQDLLVRSPLAILDFEHMCLLLE